MEKVKNTLLAGLTVIVFIWAHELPETIDMIRAAEEEMALGIDTLGLRDFIREHPTYYIVDGKWTEDAKEYIDGMHIVTATVYNPEEAQCDNTPWITADGSRINKEKLENGEIRWIAVSRDMLRKGLKYGDRVELYSEDDTICGIYEIHDTMNRRFKNSIDILKPGAERTGKWSGVVIKRL